MDNQQLQIALAFLNNTQRHVFISGKAGSGKSTFLRQLSNLTYKKLIMLAPTGVAAINIGGATIHSFFNLPTLPYTSNINQTLDKIKFDSTKRSIIAELELLVIDEVSMLRADILDMVDYVCRKQRDKTDEPFGGIQVLFVGDLHQLPPVISNDGWHNLSKVYESPFFFDSIVFKNSEPIHIELEKVYRQTDSEFISILNGVRSNTITDQEINELNSQTCNREFPPDAITLTTHNERANVINSKQLESLPGEEIVFQASVQGIFDPSTVLAEQCLKIKPGALVMILRNDNSIEKKFFNGKIGKVLSTAIDYIEIVFEDNAILKVEREIWKNISYQYDSTSGKIFQMELGTFSQFPLRLAWAMTIHKSQGLTFDKAILDISSTFAEGQLYVALSRLRSMKGIFLVSPLAKSQIVINPNVTRYREHNHFKDYTSILPSEERQFVFNYLSKLLSWDGFLASVASIDESSLPALYKLKQDIEKLDLILNQFLLEVNQIVFNQKDYKFLDNRLKACSTYVLTKLLEISSTLEAFKAIHKNDYAYKIETKICTNLLREIKDKRFSVGILQKIGSGLPRQHLGEILMDLKTNPTKKSTNFSII